MKRAARHEIAPLLGENAFGSLSALGKLSHNYLAFPFMAGVVLMFLIWVKDNIPNKLDLDWIKAGGGILRRDVEAPANAAKMYTVKSGDTLSAIAKNFYGDANRYNEIFEANRPMLSDPNMIYPGQVLRIP